MYRHEFVLKLPECFVLELTFKGATETKQMKSRAGRSEYFGDASLGAEDPGACAVALVLRAITECL
jgi:hypothetical protein